MRPSIIYDLGARSTMRPSIIYGKMQLTYVGAPWPAGNILNLISRISAYQYSLTYVDTGVPIGTEVS